MVHGIGKARATLVEYAAPEPVLQNLATAMGLDRAIVRDQILSAGERVARTLSLSSNPFSVAGTQVRVADVAGLLRVGPRLELEIAPKFLGTAWANWREDFFFISMLSSHGRLLANERLRSTTGAREDLATLVARAMISMFWENYRRPLRTYHYAHVSDFVIDGEVDPESIILPSIDGYTQRILTYDQRNVYNSAILAATQTLLPEVRDPQTRKQLVRIIEVLVPQDTIRRARHRRMPSRAKRWQSLHDLAIDVLRGFGVDYRAASVNAPGFILDTWRVWEDLTTVALRLSWGSSNVDAQRSIALGVRTSVDAGGKSISRTAFVIPDITVNEGTGLLIDAKYKGRVGDVRNRISEADLYEAMAFAAAAKQRHVVLLYPAVARGVLPPETGKTTVFERITVGNVLVFGMEVEVRGISRVGALKRLADNIRTYCRAIVSDL
jgi:hypothetical protein